DRAVRLTKRQLEDAIPSMVEIVADKDLLRAEFAISARRLELMVENLKANSASQRADLGRKDDTINRLMTELSALRDQFRDTEEHCAVKGIAKHEPERGLTDNETEMTKPMIELDQRSTLAHAQKIEIIALETQVEALKLALAGASNELKASEECPDAERRKLKAPTEHALSDKESDLAKGLNALEERSTVADSQKIEIIALKSQAEVLKEALDEASNQLKAIEWGWEAERIELKSAIQKLIEDRREIECALSDKESEL